jgi:hypothetical protein
VAVEKPLVGREVIVGAQIAACPRPAGWVEAHHILEEQHAPAGNRRRAHVGFGGAEGWAEALDDATLGKGDDLLRGEGSAFTMHRRRVEARVGGDLRRARIPDHAVGVRQFVVGEEAGLSLAHGEEQSVADKTVVMKEEDAHRPMLGVAVEVNLVVQRVAYLRQPGAESHLAAEQPVDAFALVDEVGAEIGNQQQIGLPRFDQHAHGHTPMVQIPGVGADVGLRPDHALLPDRASHGVDAEYAVCQQQRRHGHAHLAHIVILLGKDRSQNLGDSARCQMFELLAIQRGAGVRIPILARGA